MQSKIWRPAQLDTESDSGTFRSSLLSPFDLSSAVYRPILVQAQVYGY